MRRLPSPESPHGLPSRSSLRLRPSLSSLRPPSRAVPAAIALAALAALGGCGSSPPTRYYTLQAVPPPSGTGGTAYQGPPLRVRSVQVPPALDRQELVQATAPGQIEVSELDHWAAPLARLARQTLAEDLAARLPGGKLAFPGASWPEGAAELSADILSFQVSDGSALMLVGWTLRFAPPDAAAPALPPRGAQLRLQAQASPGPAGAARAWSELLGQLADQVVADLRVAKP